MARAGESVAFSAGTVIAALLTLVLATFGLYSSLGVPLAIAIALMLLAALTLLPALLAIFGRSAFWPSRTTRGGRPGWWGRPRPRSATSRAGSAGAPPAPAGFGLRRGQRAARGALPGRQRQPDQRAAAVRHAGVERCRLVRAPSGGSRCRRSPA